MSNNQEVFLKYKYPKNNYRVFYHDVSNAKHRFWPIKNRSECVYMQQNVAWRKGRGKVLARN